MVSYVGAHSFSVYPREVTKKRFERFHLKSDFTELTSVKSS